MKYPVRRNTEGPRMVARYYRVVCGYQRRESKQLVGRKPGQPTPRKALDPMQQQAFVRALGGLQEPSVQAALLLSLLAGLRVSEVCSLTPDRLRAPATLMVFGKGSKWREVPLSSCALVTFHVYMAEVAKKRRRPTAAALQAACRRLAKNPQLRGLTPHVLRHTYATNSVRACLPPKALQASLGHNSFKTTLTYLHGLGEL